MIYTPGVDGRVDLISLMRELAAREMDGVLIEGGGTLNWSALSAGIVKKAYVFVAPKMLGGATAKSPVGGAGFASPDEGAHFAIQRTERLGDDILIECGVK